MATIHDLIFIEICSHLDPQSAARCLVVSKEWRKGVKHESIWRDQCRTVWNAQSKVDVTRTKTLATYYEAFVNFAAHFWCYRNIYSSIEGPLRVIRCAVLDSQDVPPPVLDIAALLLANPRFHPYWKQLRPEHQLCLLLCTETTDAILFGAYTFYNQSYVNAFWRLGDLLPNAPSAPKGVHVFSYKWFLDDESGELLELSGAAWGRTHQVYALVAPSLQAYLSQLAGQIKSGEIEVRAEGGERVLSPFPVRGPSVACAITEGVRVTAHALPHFDGQSYPEVLFVYEIRIEGMPDVKPCVLRSRAWEIVDSHGVAQRVSGPGVIGLYPNVTPGSTFCYKSCSTMNDLPGYMQVTHGDWSDLLGKQVVS
jgi:uncharacterized protein affecting Mg2+/Co2+ transport